VNVAVVSIVLELNAIKIPFRRTKVYCEGQMLFSVIFIHSLIVSLKDILRVSFNSQNRGWFYISC